MTNTSVFETKENAGPVTGAQVPHETGAELPEGATLERARAGDSQALEVLLLAARPRLGAVALKIVRDPDEAEDVVQEAMLKVWRYVSRFEGRAALSTWLHRIVVNTALDHLRSRRHGVTTGRTGDDRADEDRRSPPAVDDQTPEDLMERAQVGAVIRNAMSGLSTVHREVLSLRELDGESYQAIAGIVRCPVGTVMSRLHHARHRLAESLASGCPDLIPRAA